MKLKKQIFLFVLIMVVGSPFYELFSQESTKKPSRQSSLEAFSKGNFEKAYSEFSELLLTYSKDPLYKYYSGVCLVKLKRDPGEAVNFLQEALQGSQIVKKLPSDALFFLGKAQQMSGQFVEAINSYSLYAEQVGRKIAREQGVSESIQQCEENDGALTGTGTRPEELVLDENVALNNIEENQVFIETSEQPVIKEPNEEIALPSDYEIILDDALKFQFKADSINTLINEMKKELEKIPSGEASVLKSRIADNELLATSFQKSADQKYSEAQVAMNPLKNESQKKAAIQKTDNEVIKDSVKQADIKIVTLSDEKTDTSENIVPVQDSPVETYSFFKVLSKPVTDPNEKILIDAEVPEGLIYRIQVAVFRNTVAPVYFKGITPIFGFKVSGTDRTNYYAGIFRRSADANKALSSVKAMGFKDAFVVALLGNKRISTDRANVLEKEWGQIPFKDMAGFVAEVPVDTVPPTLSFRVEIIRSEEPLEEDIIAEMRRISGNRGFTIQPVDGGSVAYLIGKFITFESADEYADLLVRNGYREARVAAWLGNKEIPVETARQLFDFLE